MEMVIKSNTNNEELSSILQKLKEQKNKKGLDAHKDCGKITLKKNALTIQKDLRDEWE